MGLKVHLSGTVNEAVFMSCLYTWMHFGLRFSVQVFRNRVDNRPWAKKQDLQSGGPALWIKDSLVYSAFE